MFLYEDDNGQFFISKFTVEYNEDSQTYSVRLYTKDLDEDLEKYFEVDEQEFATYDEVLNFLKKEEV
tara:strand:+ start:12744 stop:12944 length:201 start_codon:yes stop_codon:yes gene_type:complete